jgi:hypothetical protein
MGRGGNQIDIELDVVRVSADNSVTSEILDRYSDYSLAVLAALADTARRESYEQGAFDMSIAHTMVADFNKVGWSDDETFAHEKRVRETLSELQDRGLTRGDTFWNITDAGYALLDTAWDHGRSIEYVIY